MADDASTTGVGRRPLPAGGVTLFFSDIEGSTRAWEQHPLAMPGALAQHSLAVRGAIEARGGVVVKDTGDGVFAAFASAAAAIAAAVEAQRALQGVSWGETGPLRARIGLHTAEIEPEHGDYHGPAVNRCARIMGVAHGGQVLISEATHREALPPGADISFLDLGAQRLRDLSATVRLFQVLHPELPAEFPPVRSIGVLPNNLPAELSSLVGRDAELAELAGLLTGARLLTLTGSGGVGKTRLALQLAADLAEEFADGVWLTDLSGLAEPALVAQQIASALRLHDQPGRTWLDAVAWYLRDKQVVLLLDNCEHLLGAAADAVATLLERCPRVKVLATSREALGVAGEVVWRVPPLPVGRPGRPAEAERLFLERAGEVDAHALQGEPDLEAIVQICRALDGLPLAIELAAARTRVLSAREISARLDDRFRLLTGGRRTALPRQRALEATVAWSYDLLDDRERAVFDRLSVFAGGFTLAAVEQVCAGGPIEASDVLDLLTSLVDRSLVVHERGDQESSRFAMLETLRVYGRQRLLDRGELRQVRASHLAWANDFARAAEPHLDGPDQERWLVLVAADLDNVRAALGWALDGGDSSVGLACAATLYRYWYVRAVREGRLWLDRLLAAAEHAPAKLVAKALHAAGDLTQFQGDNEAARGLHHRALEIYVALGNRRGEAWALQGLGRAEWGAVAPQEVKSRFEAALAIFRQLHDLGGIAFTLQYLALWEAHFGSPAGAQKVIEEYMALVIPTQVPQLVAHGLEMSAIAAWRASGELESSRTQFRQALDLYRQIGSVYCTLHCLESIAAAAHDTLREDAARLLAAVDALRAEGGTPVPPYERLYYDQACAELRVALGPVVVAEQTRLGRSLDLGAATELAGTMLGAP